MRVALTGGTGAGKSEAAREFARLGATVISSDEIARDVVRPGGAAYRAIAAKFGRRFLKADGGLDRVKIGEKVFSSAKARRALERLTHPLILREIKRRVGLARDGAVVVADIPLLFEGGHQRLFDAAVLIRAPESARLARIAARDHLSRFQARRRILTQWTDERKAALADVVIANDGGKAAFLRAVRGYYKALALIASARKRRSALRGEK